ncbi:hypothetical protein CEXT_98631 [Caerostris extrusa]|uniref:Uncharacterized protein n=1 Tax=Caerostris extrusa TaxID=172846 RepID=A0AAV4XKG0_CAEEX|nr:hypothetical protein CEXT_98631 [Caerostris extrusa]
MGTFYFVLQKYKCNSRFEPSQTRAKASNLLICNVSKSPTPDKDPRKTISFGATVNGVGSNLAGFALNQWQIEAGSGISPDRSRRSRSGSYIGYCFYRSSVRARLHQMLLRVARPA